MQKQKKKYPKMISFQSVWTYTRGEKYPEENKFECKLIKLHKL